MMDVLILREILSPWSTTSHIAHIAHARVLPHCPLQIIQIGNEQYVPVPTSNFNWGSFLSYPTLPFPFPFPWD